MEYVPNGVLLGSDSVVGEVGCSGHNSQVHLVVRQLRVEGMHRGVVVQCLVWPSLFNMCNWSRHRGKRCGDGGLCHCGWGVVCAGANGLSTI
eukprot:2609603-Amphidinium_carterae.1